jgi:hypothetical protein
MTVSTGRCPSAESTYLLSRIPLTNTAIIAGARPALIASFSTPTNTAPPRWLPPRPCSQ